MSLSPEDFRELYLANYPATPLALRELAAEYHRRTEEYDRTVCTGPVERGAIQPANVNELFLVNNYARHVWRELERKSVAQGFTGEEFRREVTRAVPDAPFRKGVQSGRKL